MKAALLLLTATTLALSGAALWPRKGQAVLLAFPFGEPPGAAFAAPGWQVLEVGAAGRLAWAVLLPDSPQADPLLLRQATGALLATRATRSPGCTTPARDT